MGTDIGVLSIHADLRFFTSMVPDLDEMGQHGSISLNFREKENKQSPDLTTVALET